MEEKNQKTLEELEQEKLSIEIQKLQTPWYRTSKWWAVFITGAAVVGTVLITWLTGIIDVSRERLENDKAVLQIEIHEFEDRRDSLELQTILLHDSLDHVRDSLYHKEAELLQSNEANKKLRRDRFQLQENCEGMYDYYESYIDSLETHIAKAAALRSITADNTDLTVDSNVLVDHTGAIIVDHNGNPIFSVGGQSIVFPTGSSD